MDRARKNRDRFSDQQRWAGRYGAVRNKRTEPRERNNSRQYFRFNAADASLLPLLQAQKARRDSKRQLVSGFSSDSKIGRLCGEQSLRDEFFRSVARGIAGHVGNRDGALSRSGHHRIP